MRIWAGLELFESVGGEKENLKSLRKILGIAQRVSGKSPKGVGRVVKTILIFEDFSECLGDIARTFWAFEA